MIAALFSVGNMVSCLKVLSVYHILTAKKIHRFVSASIYGYMDKNDLESDTYYFCETF